MYAPGLFFLYGQVCRVPKHRWKRCTCEVCFCAGAYSSLLGKETCLRKRKRINHTPTKMNDLLVEGQQNTLIFYVAETKSHLTPAPGNNSKRKTTPHKKKTKGERFPPRVHRRRIPAGERQRRLGQQQQQARRPQQARDRRLLPGHLLLLLLRFLFLLLSLFVLPFPFPGAAAPPPQPAGKVGSWRRGGGRGTGAKQRERRFSSRGGRRG